MCRARIGLHLIPTPVFGVDSPPRMGGWLGGWDGAIWDDFSSWTCPFLVRIWIGPFPVGDIDRPLSLTCCPPVRSI